MTSAFEAGTELLDARQLEAWTGTKASTWRLWAVNGTGPPSFCLGKRRVWRRDLVLAWLAERELDAQPDAERAPDARPQPTTRKAKIGARAGAVTQKDPPSVTA